MRNDGGWLLGGWNRSTENSGCGDAGDCGVGAGGRTGVEELTEELGAGGEGGVTGVVTEEVTEEGVGFDGVARGEEGMEG